MRAMAVATAPKRNSKHWSQSEVSWIDLLEWAESPAARKECGNYLLGTLKPNTTVMHPGDSEPCGPKLHRRKDFVVTRSALTLDIDTPVEGFSDLVELTLPYAALMHTTFSSTPDEPRYRLIIPTDRDMAPDEYVAAVHTIMQMLGAESFDSGTDQPERYMFKPSTSDPDTYEHLILDGDPAIVDDLLADFDEDLSSLPMPKPHRNKRDPFTLDGVVGAFNRAYEDFAQLVDTFELPYEEVSQDRWQLIGSRSVAGMGPVAGAPGLYFSHHTTDPAFNKTCTSFDLVRLHLFGDLDEEAPEQTPINRLPSTLAMSDMAAVDYRVTAELVGFPDLDDEDDPDLANNPDAWRLGLRFNRQGKPLDIIENWDLWANHDPAFTPIYLNELTSIIEIDRDLPWRKIVEGGEVFTGTDRRAMLSYLEREYNGFKATRARVDDIVDTTAAQRRRNPIKAYLDSLVWDGVARVEECLPGVLPTAFTRMVARKCLTAAVARVYSPGCKWDHTLVLFGSEGLGKSWWIEKLARGWMTTLGPINSKDTLLAMQRSWIMVSDEGHSLRKGDADAQKEFLTRTEDSIRMPYDRETIVHKRHCVIWSTTNDETFLRRQEGNRRFLIVECVEKVDFDSLPPSEVDQLWAEAVHLYRSGESLFLDGTQAQVAAAERERYVEEDALGGIVSQYLDTRVPADWDEMSPETRAAWLTARADGFEAEGTERIMQVCSMQIWVEAMGRKRGEHRRTELLDITNAIKRQDGWELLPGKHRVAGYGPQTIYGRVSTTAEDLEDVL